MDSLIQIAIDLSKLPKVVYFHTDVEVLDFTNKKFETILNLNEIKLKLSCEQLIPLLGLLKQAILDNKDSTLIAWNFKNFIAFANHYTKTNLIPECQVFDLKITEAFSGINSEKPKTHTEAVERTKIAINAINKDIYKKIHIPLILNVLPSLENVGILDKEKRLLLHAYYEIEGTLAGRLKTEAFYKNSYMPHSIGPVERVNYKPGENNLFVYLDYRNMEVSMLQWLSKDDKLAQILNLQEDFYKVVFKLITGIDCDSDKKRAFCKSVFLPVIYGQSANSLSEKLSISWDVANSIKTKLERLFDKAFTWIKNVRPDDNGFCCDFFGRKRKLESRQWRNFFVQAPASIVCLEKLIKLKEALNGYALIVCHIHDGYMLCCNKNNLNVVNLVSKEVLEAESELCPGLRLKSHSKIGYNSAEMEQLI